jgi:general secretion pathway protein A
MARVPVAAPPTPIEWTRGSIGMYESFYGFKEKPFALTPDPQFLYLARPHRKALTLLQYSLANDAAFCVITGEVGSGKTTLIRHLLKGIEQTTTVGLISNTSIDFGRLLQWVCMSFGLAHAGKDEVTLYELFTRFLIDEYAKGRRVVLIVDEAQNLGAPRLEELRVLSNINADKHLLLQTIIVGQPELRDLIRAPRLLQLAQRISGDCHIGALSADEARHYIHHRLRVAGGRLSIFTQGAVSLAYKQSGGIPRLINQYCDQALVYGYADGHTRIDGELMTQVIEDRRSNGLVAN